MSIYDVFSGGNRPFDKVEWAAAKQAQRKEAYELIDNTCSEMVASGDSFRQYLDVQGRFDRYSVANAILVSAQMSEATQLKEYSNTKAKLPTHTLINNFEGLDKNSIILLEQVRTIDKQRLEQYLGMIPDDMVARVDKALAISVALEKIKATDV